MKYTVKARQVKLLKPDGEFDVKKTNESFTEQGYDKAKLKTLEYQGLIEDEDLKLPPLTASDAREAAKVISERKRLINKKWDSISLPVTPQNANTDIHKNTNNFAPAQSPNVATPAPQKPQAVKK